VNPAVQKGRIKVYLRTESTEWDVARDVMTLGGRLQDAVSQKRIQIMQSLWPLLQPGSGINGPVNGTSRPEGNGKRVPFWPYTGLIFNVNLTKGNDIPETQCYVSTTPTQKWLRHSSVSQNYSHATHRSQCSPIPAPPTTSRSSLKVS
jgi:hypothetical protein